MAATSVPLSKCGMQRYVYLAPNTDGRGTVGGFWCVQIRPAEPILIYGITTTTGLPNINLNWLVIARQFDENKLRLCKRMEFLFCLIGCLTVGIILFEFDGTLSWTIHRNTPADHIHIQYFRVEHSRFLIPSKRYSIIITVFFLFFKYIFQFLANIKYLNVRFPFDSVASLPSNFCGPLYVSTMLLFIYNSTITELASCLASPFSHW